MRNANKYKAARPKHDYLIYIILHQWEGGPMENESLLVRFVLTQSWVRQYLQVSTENESLLDDVGAYDGMSKQEVS